MLRLLVCQRSLNHKLKAIHNEWRLRYHAQKGVSKIVKSQIESNSQLSYQNNYQPSRVCQRSLNHKLKAIHNAISDSSCRLLGVSKIVKSQIESNSQQCRSYVFRNNGVSKIVKSQIESNSQPADRYYRRGVRCVKDR